MIKHISVILDGNRRWAKLNNHDINYGYYVGAQKVIDLINDFNSLSINFLSLYVLSTENFKRDKQNLDPLLMVIFDFLKNKIYQLTNILKIDVDFIGDISILKPEYIEVINMFKQREHFNNKCVNFAINYGSIDETLRAIKQLNQENLEITEDNLFSKLDTYKYGNPDIVIRFGKQIRLSNFMLLQSAYSELFFIDKYWPEYTKEDIETILLEFNNRKRTFGS